MEGQHPKTHIHRGNERQHGAVHPTCTSAPLGVACSSREGRSLARPGRVVCASVPPKKAMMLVWPATSKDRARCVLAEGEWSANRRAPSCVGGGGTR